MEHGDCTGNNSASVQGSAGLKIGILSHNSYISWCLSEFKPVPQAYLEASFVGFRNCLRIATWSRMCRLHRCQPRFYRGLSRAEKWYFKSELLHFLMFECRIKGKIFSGWANNGAGVGEVLFDKLRSMFLRVNICDNHQKIGSEGASRTVSKARIQKCKQYDIKVYLVAPWFKLWLLNNSQFMMQSQMPRFRGYSRDGNHVHVKISSACIINWANSTELYCFWAVYVHEIPNMNFPSLALRVILQKHVIFSGSLVIIKTFMILWLQCIGVT